MSSRNRRFSPALDSMETRLTLSSGVTPSALVASASVAQDTGIDFGTPATGVTEIPIFGNSGSAYSSASSDENNGPGIDFGSPVTGVPYIPVFG